MSPTTSTRSWSTSAIRAGSESIPRTARSRASSAGHTWLDVAPISAAHSKARSWVTAGDGRRRDEHPCSARRRHPARHGRGRRRVENQGGPRRRARRRRVRAGPAVRASPGRRPCRVRPLPGPGLVRGMSRFSAVVPRCPAAVGADEPGVVTRLAVAEASPLTTAWTVRPPTAVTRLRHARLLLSRQLYARPHRHEAPAPEGKRQAVGGTKNLGAVGGGDPRGGRQIPPRAKSGRKFTSTGAENPLCRHRRDSAAGSPTACDLGRRLAVPGVSAPPAGLPPHGADIRSGAEIRAVCAGAG